MLFRSRIRDFLRRGEMQRGPVDLNAMVEDVLALVRTEAGNQRVVLRHVPVPELPTVFADRVQMQQVLLNLVVNGIEAIGSAAGTVRTLDVRAQQHAPDMLQVDVRDTGPGIDAAIGDRIFDAFHTSKPQGMGMGLAISRSIVEAHGGRIWVRPNEGPGVTFSFTLPIEAGSADI